MADNRAIHKFKAGDVFDDRYTLERLMGSGGFADVWKATDNTTHTSIALKIYTNLDDDGINDLASEYTHRIFVSKEELPESKTLQGFGCCDKRC